MVFISTIDISTRRNGLQAIPWGKHNRRKGTLAVENRDKIEKPSLDEKIVAAFLRQTMQKNLVSRQVFFMDMSFIVSVHTC